MKQTTHDSPAETDPRDTVAELMEKYRKGELSLSDNNVMKITGSRFAGVTEGANGNLLIPVDGPPKPCIHQS